MRIAKKALFDTLPPEWPVSLLPEIKEAVEKTGEKIVVLDDDPTGTQTVRDVTVLTRWDVPSLCEVFQEPEPIVYILTNSRSFSLPEAQEINREIAGRLEQARRITRPPRAFSIISRSDSTLRGHFPGEVEALRDELGKAIDGILVIPFFEEGGRYTIDDTHYVAEKESLVPAGETEYARDATFGYRSSDLRQWVAEKSGGEIKTEEVASISLETIRKGGPGAVRLSLCRLEKNQVCVVNAASYRDLEVLVAGLLQAEAAGVRMICRTAASFVRVRGGLEPYPLLTAAELCRGTSQAGRPRADSRSSERSVEQTALGSLREVPLSAQGGLIVAGSYIRKSSEQIAAVQALPGVAGLEVSVEKLLDDNARLAEITRVKDRVDQNIAARQDALVFTSRRLVTGGDAAASLAIGRSVSDALVEIVRRLAVRPAWIIAKGGITSSDVATKALKIGRARVIGQILPGVPVWRAGPGSRWPDLVYVVFPGNVGGPGAIVEAIEKLRRAGESRGAGRRAAGEDPAAGDSG
jgi:uncharacterized protein YgbK (DUF1537 family)